MKRGGRQMNSCGIYIHIPFCVRKCLYCDFNSGEGSEELIDEYVDALCREIDAACEEQMIAADTVFIGGGTPSCIDPRYIEKILCKLKDNRCFELCKPSREITIEVNPGTVTLDGLHNYRRMGINRISIGIQSLQDEELKALGRIHNAKQAEETVLLASEAGFDNISIDLMYGIPGQTVKSFADTLEKATALNPSHISCYSLIIEEGTPFFEMYSERDPVSEEELMAMDELAHEYLPKKGYLRYEVSNYALPGRECRHNRGYWHRRAYRGFGLSAASLIRRDGQPDIRFTGEEKINEYIADCSAALCDRKNAQEFRELTRSEAMEEFMFLGLRECGGVSAADFEREFDSTVEYVFGGVIDRYLESGHLKMTKEGEKRYFFSAEGMNVSTRILADFLLE